MQTCNCAGCNNGGMCLAALMVRPSGLTPDTERYYVNNPHNGQPQRLNADGIVRALRCACCGSDAGRFHQFPNQDDGWGLCAKCAGWIEQKEGANYVTWCYGVAGVHREDPGALPLPVDVLPATKPEWAYDEMEADFKARRYVWREVTDAFYWQALEVLPPIYAAGGFLVGEPWSHTANDEEICAAFYKTDARYFATMSTARGMAKRVRGLLHVLAQRSAVKCAGCGWQGPDDGSVCPTCQNASLLHLTEL